MTLSCGAERDWAGGGGMRYGLGACLECCDLRFYEKLNLPFLTEMQTDRVI